VLDLGCGSGGLTVELAALTPSGRVVGIDTSESMIREAQRRAGEKGLGNIIFLQEDVLAVTYRDEFDVVFSNSLATWVENQNKLVCVIKRALNDGGRVGIQAGAAGGFDAEFMAEIGPQIMQRERFADAIKRQFSIGWTPPSKVRLLTAEEY